MYFGFFFVLVFNIEVFHIQFFCKIKSLKKFNDCFAGQTTFYLVLVALIAAYWKLVHIGLKNSYHPTIRVYI